MDEQYMRESYIKYARLNKNMMQIVSHDIYGLFISRE